MQESIEDVIFKNLIKDGDYASRVYPFLKEEYFQEDHHKILFHAINDYVVKFGAFPNTDILSIEIKDVKGLTDDTFKNAKNLLQVVEKSTSEEPLEWLIKSTEDFCKDRSIYNAVLRSVKILDGSDKHHTKESLPQLLQEALAISFDSKVGHDYFEDAKERYEFYHKKEKKIPFDLDLFNKITDGGFSTKTLNVFLAPPKSGKTMMLCHLASAYLLQGKNVLYITLEMSEEKIAERIDANLMGVTMKDVKNLLNDSYTEKIVKLRKSTIGTLIIKEYPTASASSAHFRNLMNELKLKKNMNVDVVMIDYINICSSQRYKAGAVNSYTFVKAVCEELRGLAVEFDCPIISATQAVRSAWDKQDMNMADTSESAGLPATVDILLAIIRTEQFDEQNKVMIKQLANRYNDTAYYRRFLIGSDRSKMKFYNVEQEALPDDPDGEGPGKSFENNAFGSKLDKISKATWNF